MDRLLEIQGILADEDARAALTDEELVALEQELMALFDAIRAGEVEDVEVDDTERLNEIVVATEQIRTEAATRIEAREAEEAEQAEARAEREAATAELERRMRGEVEDPDAEGDEATTTEENGDEGADDGDAGGGADGGDEESTVEEEQELVTAGGAPAPIELPSLADLAARGAQRPVAPPRGHAGARTEHPFIRALTDGTTVTLTDFAQLMWEKRQDFGAYSGDGEERVRLGRISIRDAFSEERRLYPEDSQFVNDRKVEALVAAAEDPASWTDEIVASGGFCAPTEALYDLEQISTAARPLRDGLPDFRADRGGIRFTPPPDLGDVLVDQSGGAVGEWSNATDTNPGGATKSCQTVTCQAVTEVLTRAIYRCLGFGNFQSRAYPENVQAWVLNAASAWARKSEQEALDDISANSTPVTTTKLIGAMPDLLAMIIQLRAGEVNRQRMGPRDRLRVLLPAWVVDLFAVDGLRRMPGDGFKVYSEGDVRGLLAAAGVNATFYIDQRTGGDQIFGAQGAGNDLKDFPDVVEWFAFHEGAHTYLDGGELDLGLVRDSTLNNTNDYRIFAEHWQAVAFRGIFSYRVRSTVCPTGEAAALTSTSTLCAAS